MERFLVHNPLDIRLDLGTQPHYKAPGNVQVKIVETLWFTLGESGISSIIAQSWPWENRIKVKKKMMKKLMKRLRFIKKKLKFSTPQKKGHSKVKLSQVAYFHHFFSVQQFPHLPNMKFQEHTFTRLPKLSHTINYDTHLNRSVSWNCNLHIAKK